VIKFITGKRITAFVLVALLQFTAVALHAQAASSSLSGTIVDGSGGAIPSAQVTVTNVATSAKKDVQADSNGHYAVSSLAAGTYTVEASAIGFTMNSRPGVVLGEGQSLQVGLALTISTVVQEVTVNGGIESIAAEAAPSGGFVEERSARSLVSNIYIENFTSPISDYGEIVQIVPGTFTTSSDGVGLGQSKTYFRGFADGEYDIDFDGIPFFDSNSPSHHSWAFFPAQWDGGVDVDRSPGTASTIGPDPFGGTIHLLSKPLTTEQQIRSSVSWGTWNTQLYDFSFNSGLFGILHSGKKMNMWADFHQMSSNGFQTLNYNQRDGGSLSFQYQISPRTVLTGFSGVIQLSTNAPSISSTRCMLYGVSPTGAYSCTSANTANGLLPYTGSGIKFLLTPPNAADPANWFSAKYNNYHIPTDFEYVGLKKDMAKGWYLDFKGYTYNYDNAELYSNPTAQTDVSQAAALATPTLVPGTFVTGGVAYYDGAKIASCNNTGLTTTLNTTPWPCGVDKYNSYRKYGETSMLTQTSQLGVLRTGLWYEWARTDRHQYPTDPTNNWVDQALPNFAEQFWTNSFQPFAEFEFHATPKLNISPGVKFFSYSLNILHHGDNGATVGPLSAACEVAGTTTGQASDNTPCAATVSDTGTFNAWVPSLDLNYRIQNNWSFYIQAATGAAAPPSSTYDYNHTVSTTNPTPGLAVAPKLQKSTTYQAGTVLKAQRITFDMDGYLVRFQNTYTSVVDSTAGDPLYGQSIYYLQPSSVTQGVEFESTAVLAKGLYLYLNGTAGNSYYRGKFNVNAGSGNASAPAIYEAVPSGLWVANTPTDTEMQGLTYTDHGFDLGIFNHRIGEQRIDNKSYHNQSIVAPFNTVNTFVNYTVHGGSWLNGTKIRLSGNNLLNSQQIQNNKLGGKANTIYLFGGGTCSAPTVTNPCDAFNTNGPTAISGADTPTIAAGRSLSVSVTFGISPKGR
jgi:iron complex outermembrane receptor protein